jgi:hypothetical protein
MTLDDNGPTEAPVFRAPHLYIPTSIRYFELERCVTMARRPQLGLPALCRKTCWSILVGHFKLPNASSILVAHSKAFRSKSNVLRLFRVAVLVRC